MKIFQPMLFVGLGGTGGLVGTELERRLRAELCGPDGTALNSLGIPLRYQLPECLQFVYSDFSESELARLPHLSADASLRAAYSRTARATHDLLPDHDSSPEVTRELRAVMRDEVSGWLPPRAGEPKVTPLRNGAGQLPTVGRAALFGTLRNGLDSVMGPLMQAIDAISRSGGELSQLGGGPMSGCDVFVAHSVAGGTGAGIFLDYLHLIGEAFRAKNFTGARIYPLVVMPSAFPASAGGGREAELNAARAVVDLFRLVDEQNVPTAESDLGDTDFDSAMHIRYPGVHPIKLRTGMVPTAFLFSRTAGIRPDDLRRSIVSLVMSLVGTELGDGTGPRPRADDDYQTFAASFINRGLHRAARAASGIGHRGVSTSLVASMTAPLDELAELVSSRMLAMSVRRLTEPGVRPSHEYVGTVRKMFTDSGLEELWTREALTVPEPDPLPRGGVAIAQALRDRISDMQALLEDLRRKVERRAPALAEQFAPRVALERVLRTTDLFQAERIIKGVPGDPDPVTAIGFLGMLENRSRQPARPAGVNTQPPAVPRIRGRIGGLSKARWGDAEVAAAVEEQDRWYQWRCRAVWHEAWRRQEQRWRPAAAALNSEVTVLVEAFRKHVEEEPRAFEEHVQELYDDRTGVSYLLPPQNNLRDFYDDLRERLVKRVNLGDNDDESALLLKLVDGDRWQAAHAAGRRNPAAAVATVKAAVEQRIKSLFAESGMQADERPLLPSMAMLLSAAAGVGDAAEEIGKSALEQFRFKIAGLLPHGFVPEGGGPLKILIVYPRLQNKDAVEEYLRKSLLLPRDGKRSIEFRGVETDSITVVLFRSEMSLTEVPEARNVLRRWALARDVEQSEDVLSWRQRLGYRDDWLASTEEDRQHILHRLLCAMWNGQVTVVEGDVDSPRRVRVRLYEEDGPDVPGMTLRLDDYQGEISGWAGLLRSYERWALLDEGRIVEDYCSVLMRVQPSGLALSGSRPDPLYVRFVNDIARRQLELLEKLEHHSGQWSPEWVRPLRTFWAETLPGALDVMFTEKRALQPTLRSLEAAMRNEQFVPPGFDPAPPPAPPRAPRNPKEDWGTVPLRRDSRDQAGDAPPPAGAGDGGPEPAARPYTTPERGPADRDHLYDWPGKPRRPERLTDDPEPEGERPSAPPAQGAGTTRAADTVTGPYTGRAARGRSDAVDDPAGDEYPWEVGSPDDVVPSPRSAHGTAERPVRDQDEERGQDSPRRVPGGEPVAGASSAEYPPFPDDASDGWPDRAEHDVPWTTTNASADTSRSAPGTTPDTASERRVARDPWEGDPE
ncbi:tubulin-like doman-containing protein [Streptomyces massasporeus]|uniref:tubulin-like doman-containing protein n=1 Tax=Streptomyces massasporeus TaxID=67324 RepID=UPI00369323EA